MKFLKKNLTVSDKWYITAILLCIAGFFLPSISMEIGGEKYIQWFITTYGGIVVFVNLLLFGPLLQGVLFIKKGRLLPWVGLVTGAYVFLYAGNQLLKCFVRFKTAPSLTLVDKLQPHCSALAGVWLLLASGILLFMVAAIKVVSGSLSATKQPAKAR